MFSYYVVLLSHMYVCMYVCPSCVCMHMDHPVAEGLCEKREMKFMIHPQRSDGTVCVCTQSADCVYCIVGSSLCALCDIRC